MNGDTGAVLRKTPLFANLTEAELQALVRRTSRRRFGQGEHLFAEGDPCAGLFLVASGKVRIFKLSASGREQVLAVEGPGSSFAELPVFDGATTRQPRQPWKTPKFCSFRGGISRISAANILR
jgi:CRP-like cAMP-binding protein